MKQFLMSSLFLVAVTSGLMGSQPSAEPHVLPDGLFDAIEHDDDQGIRELFSHEPSEEVHCALETKISSQGMTPLMYAVWRGCPSSTKTLIDLGSDVNAHDEGDRLSVLMYACRSDDNRIINALVNAQADVTYKDRFNRTALIHAAVYGHPNAVKVLLEHGSNPNERDDSGSTPLLYTIEYEDCASAQCLVNSGADVNLVDSTGMPPLFYAIFKRSYDHVALLKAAGASLAAVDGEGRTLEQFCTLYADDKTRELLDLTVSATV